MSNLSNTSASDFNTPASTTQLPRLPYEIFILVVEAFIESAHAEFSAEPGLWQLESKPVVPLVLIPGAFFILDYDYDGKNIWSKRFRLLRNISQADLRSRCMVNERFPRHPFIERCKYPAPHRFVHICTKVDVFRFNPALNNIHPVVKPRFWDLLKVIENVHIEGGYFSLKSLSALPNLKSVSFSTDRNMGTHEHDEHGVSYPVHEPHCVPIFSGRRWETICEASTIWEKGVRLFLNQVNNWRPGDWQVAEIFYVPATAEKKAAFRMRWFTVGCEGCLDALPPGARLLRYEPWSRYLS